MRENSSAARIGAPIDDNYPPDRTSLREIAGGLAELMRCRRGQEIYCQEGAAPHWYRGAARRFSLRSDGRRQIVDLLVPGDIFGFGVRDRHRFSVEAVSDGTVIARYSRAQLEARVEADPRLAYELQEVAFEAMSRLHSQIMILGRTTAEEKVGASCFTWRRAWPEARPVRSCCRSRVMTSPISRRCRSRP
jgi:CRP-like cAMP-binding protein